MRWISSAGGPLIALPGAAAPLWRGEDPGSGHYEAGCEIEYAGLIDLPVSGTRYPVLILWDEPLSTTYLAERGAILQWRYADAEDDLLALVEEGWPVAEWAGVGSVSIFGPWIIFDAAQNGRE